MTFTPSQSGTLTVGGGGTGQTSFTGGSVIYGNGTGVLSSIATTTLSSNNGITISGGAGFLIGGSNATIGLSAIAANSILANVTGASGVPTALATSSLFAGTSGQVLAFTANGITGVATTTFSSGLSYSGGNVTNTGLLSLQQLGGGTAQTGAITFATSSQTTNGQTIGLNITNASGAFTFAPTLSGTLTVAGGGTGVGSFTASQLVYGNGTNALSSVATSSLTFTGPFNGISTLGALVGGSNSTVVYTGLATTTALSSSQILYSTNGAAGVAGAATTTFTPSAEFTVGGTIGSFVGGANSTLTLATAGVALTKLATQAANTVLVNQTGGAASPTAIATSTFGTTLFGVGTNGAVLAEVNGVPTWVATTTAGTGLSYSAGSFNVNTTQNITTLSNLTTDGIVYTSGGNGTLNVDSGALDTARGGTATTTWMNGALTFFDSGLGTLSQAATQAALFFDKTNSRLGLGTTTPGTLFSLGNTGNNTINIDANATSTFGSGLNIRTGCFAVNGTCISTGGSGITALAGMAAGLAAGGAGSLRGGGGQVMLPSLTTVRPRMASSSILTLMTPSLVLHSSSESRNRLVAYSVEDCLARREARSV